MPGLGAPTFPCGHTVTKNHTKCPTCYQQEQKRRSRLSLNQQSRSDLTPPPEEAPSPRTTSKKVNATLNRAFSSEEEHPDLFPPSFYRDRTPSRPRTKDSPTRTDESRPPSARASLSPDDASTRDRSYSPMAAAFSRLNVKEGGVPGSPPSQRGRPSGASMFGGPA